MEIRDGVLELATLFFESHTRMGNVDEKLSGGIKDFIVQVCVDGNITYDNLFDDKDEDRIKTLKEEVWKDILNADPLLWFALCLYNKGEISEKHMRDALCDTEWRTCCHGDYIKSLEKRYGVKINKTEM